MRYLWGGKKTIKKYLLDTQLFVVEKPGTLNELVQLSLSLFFPDTVTLDVLNLFVCQLLAELGQILQRRCRYVLLEWKSFSLLEDLVGRATHNSGHRLLERADKSLFQITLVSCGECL